MKALDKKFEMGMDVLALILFYTLPHIHICHRVRF